MGLETIANGRTLFSAYAERLHYGSLLDNLSISERQDLERKLGALTQQQRKYVHINLRTQELLSEIHGDSATAEYLTSVAEYFKRKFPWREFVLLQGGKI